MSSASTRGIRFWITSSLSDTFAPPRIATNGRSGCSSTVPEVLDLRRHQQPRGRLLDVLDDAFGRGVRAVRRAERVVDVDVGERGELLRRTPGRSSLPPRGSAGSRAGRPRRRCRPSSIAVCAGSPTQSSANTTGRSSSSDSRVGDRLQRVLAGSACPWAGRDASRGSTVAPLLQRVLDRRQRRADARVVADRAVLDRHVEVDADEDPPCPRDRDP